MLYLSVQFFFLNRSPNIHLIRYKLSDPAIWAETATCLKDTLFHNYLLKQSFPYTHPQIEFRAIMETIIGKKVYDLTVEPLKLLAFLIATIKALVLLSHKIDIIDVKHITVEDILYLLPLHFYWLINHLT